MIIRPISPPLKFLLLTVHLSCQLHTEALPYNAYVTNHAFWSLSHRGLSPHLLRPTVLPISSVPQHGFFCPPQDPCYFVSRDSDDCDKDRSRGNQFHGLPGSTIQLRPFPFLAPIWSKLSPIDQAAMRGMSAEDIITSLQGDAETKTEMERRTTETRLSLDLVATSILEAKADLHLSLIHI